MHATRFTPAFLLVIAAPLALGLIFARPATADHWQLEPALPVGATEAACAGEGSGTVCHYALTRQLPFTPTATCSDVTLQATAESPGDFVWYYDRFGQLAHESAIYAWSGKILNPLTGESVAYDGQGMQTTDFVEGLGTYTYSIHVPAGDIVAVIRGQFAFDTSTLETVSDSPEGQDAYAAQVCALLPSDPALTAPQPGRPGQPY
jgi:hypothetical protein